MKFDSLADAPRRISPGLTGLSPSPAPKLDWHGAMTRLTRLASKKRRRTILSAWAVAVDLAAISAAFLVASLLRIGSIDEDQLVRILVCILPIYMGVALNNQSHHVTTLLNDFKSAWRAATALAFAAGAMLLVAFFMKIGEDFSRLLFGVGTVLALTLLVLWRYGLARIGQRYLGDSPFADLCIYDGVERSALSGAEAIDADAVGLSSPYPNDPAVVANLARVAHGMDRVIVHCRPEQRTQWAFMLRSLDVPSEIVTPELTDLYPLGIGRRSGQASLLLGGGTLSWSQRLLKRSFDLAVTVPVLPLLLPLLAAIALVVKLDSPGPAFFRQERIGLGNRKFHILKFRTMRVESCDAKIGRAHV